MKNKLAVLLKTQILTHSNFNVLRFEKDKNKKAKIIGIYIAIAFVLIMVSAYCFGLGYAYGYLGMAYLLPEYAVAIASVVVLIFTFCKTNGFLFAFRDYDMLMALPFSLKTIISAKFLYMYVGNLGLTIFVMLPIGAAYTFWEKPGILVYLFWILITLFTPLLPMTIASMVGACITAISSKFKHKVMIEAILTFGLVVVIMAGSFLLSNKLEMEEAETFGELFSALENSQIKEIGIVIQKALHQIYPLSAWCGQAVREQSIGHIVGFVGASLGIYIVFLVVLARFYKQINTALMTSQQTKKYQMQFQTKNSLRKALVLKEFRRFTSSSLYLTNMGVGIILAIMGSVLCMFFDVDTILTEVSLLEFREGILHSVPFIVGTLVSMSCTTSISLSLEGKHYWILQSLPISKKDIYQGKMIFNVILQLPVALICCTLLGIAFHANIVDFIFYFIASIANVAFSTVFGMMVGIKFANFEWANEVEVIKQGAASMIGILGSMLYEIVLVALVVGLSFLVDGRIVVLGISFVLVGISVGIYGKLVEK